MNSNFKRYIVFWFSQALSQLGSSMTGFALILWAYTQNGSAMTVSLMSFFNYVPYIFVSLLAGNFVDSHSKKKIMLVADTVAAVCSAMILTLSVSNCLQIWNIYVVNFILGFMNAFQGPASNVAVGKIVPKDKLAQISGMNSFSNSMVMVLSPILAASLFAWGGLKLILAVDLGSFLFAFCVLLFVLRIPDDVSQKFSRSGNDSVTLGMVNAVMGIGGIIGGIIVSTGKVKANSAKMIYIPAMLSFLFGDVLMGVGRNTLIWSLAGIAASLPIAFINAGQTVI